MAADNPIPLATSAQMQEGAFADLARAFSGQALTDIMIEATRACETESGRRLVPFTVTESHRAEGVDPDELGDATDLPIDLMGALGRSYASALSGGTSSQVRHCWLNEYAPLYQDFWAYSNVSLTVIRSYGGSQQFSATQIIGPEPDTGHVWFSLGVFLPIASLIRATYSGGYTTVPADLVRACKYMAAAIITRELDPLSAPHGHSPDALEALAVSWLSPYTRG
ncbi:MAG: hypothetical protein JWO67_3196 [Streptosporangiaceae bacterium]|nr:hypothetical protein [Streptosporangiaceae bacterium]